MALARGQVILFKLAKTLHSFVIIRPTYNPYFKNHTHTVPTDILTSICGTWFSEKKRQSNRVNRLVFVMEPHCVFFAVGTKDTYTYRGLFRNGVPQHVYLTDEAIIVHRTRKMWT